MKRLFKSFGFAFKGLAYAFGTQSNFRIHLFLTVIAVGLGCSLHITVNEWIWIMLCITLVLSAELFNTALETLTDLVSPGYNEKAGHVKDIAAAGVIITAIFALAVGLIIFLPKIILLFHAA